MSAFVHAVSRAILAVSPVAVGVGLLYGLVIAAAVGRGCMRRAWFLAALLAGAVAFWVAALLVDPIQALVAYVFGWEIDAYSVNVGIGLVGALIAAAINEIFKLAAALMTLARGGTEADAAAFGAAAGAGFGAFGAYQVIALALIARTLPIGTGSLATPLVQQFGFVAANAASTALVTYGATHRRLGMYLLVAVLYETLYGILAVLFGQQLLTLQTWTLLGVVIGLGLLGYAVALSLRPAASRATS